MRKTDIYNVITDLSMACNKGNMQAMQLYLNEQGLMVTNEADLYKLTVKVQELIEILEDTGEIKLAQRGLK